MIQNRDIITNGVFDAISTVTIFFLLNHFYLSQFIKGNWKIKRFNMDRKGVS
jgi:hypothetical protein